MLGQRGRGVGPENEAGQGRQQHENEDGGDVFDDQPAHGDAAVVGGEDPADFKRLQKHHGRGARKRRPEDERLPPGPIPKKCTATAPNTVAIAIWSTAPGSAIALTLMRSFTEKCRPTPNISSITPISDNWCARAGSAKTPGVCCPAATPASR